MDESYLTPSVKSRFWKYVDRRDPNECWNWTGYCDGGKMPYGRLFVRGRVVKAHRISYQIHFGAIPHGAKILHRCDNPRCVNPDHIYAGTLKENARDMIERGRKHSLAGTNNPRAILTPVDVINIRRDYPAVSTRALASRYNVSPATISAVLTGRNWKGV